MAFPLQYLILFCAFFVSDDIEVSTNSMQPASYQLHFDGKHFTNEVINFFLDDVWRSIMCSFICTGSILFGPKNRLTLP